MDTSSSSDKHTLPLQGIRVLEMGQLIAGPFAAQILAAYGAEVVKVEAPLRGDPLRTWRLLDDNGTSYWWHSIARGKQSITLDLSDSKGCDIARRLIQKSDVLIENFRPGKMESWGLGPDSFHTAHPELIYTRVSGYGQDGPYASKPGFASACEAMAGLRYLNGHPNEKPVRMNLSLGDSLAGMHAAMGVMLGLISRTRSNDKTKPASCVDVSIMESVFNMMEGVLPEYSGSGCVREPSGSTVTGIVPTNTYRCKDGRYVVIGGNGDSIFKRLMVAVGRSELAEDERLASNQGRVQHERMIDEVLENWCSKNISSYVLQTLDNADVPVGPVNSIADISNDPQFQARGAFEQVKVGEQLRTVPAMHPKIAQGFVRDDTPGPALGEHTDQVLAAWLGMDSEHIEQLREQGLV